MEKYCESVGIEDNVYLEGFSRPNRIRLMGAFAMDMREGQFSRRSHGPLAESLIRGAISFVSLFFRDNDRPNPTKDEDGDLRSVLSRLFWALRNKHSNPNNKKPSLLKC